MRTALPLQEGSNIAGDRGFGVDGDKDIIQSRSVNREEWVLSTRVKSETSQLAEVESDLNNGDGWNVSINQWMEMDGARGSQRQH